MTTNAYTTCLRPTYHNDATSNELNNEEDQGDENVQVEDDSDPEHGDSDSDKGDSDTDSNEGDWQDYTGEDGEEPWDVDDTDALGFAEF